MILSVALASDSSSSSFCLLIISLLIATSCSCNCAASLARSDGDRSFCSRLSLDFWRFERVESKAVCLEGRDLRLGTLHLIEISISVLMSVDDSSSTGGEASIKFQLVDAYAV